ncbi:MAG: T9SS type A sorting domain-containing protein, partial [Schleiferiaceae bacterium]|nr:T9SS type A sorting domain-containing protein [Schleiferiaceae bacterium]
GCDSIITLVVNALPQQTGSTSATICEGDTATFAGQSFTAAGTYPVVLSGSFGCDSTVAFTVQVLPAYTDTFSNTICQGDSVFFEGSYYSQTGVYNVGYTTPSGCDSSLVLVLDVTSQPTTPLIVINAALTGMEVVPSNAVFYEWERNGATLPNDTLFELINPSSGIYRVRYLENGCFSDWSDTLRYSGINTSLLTGGIKIQRYPNPTTGLLQLSTSQALKDIQIIVTSSTGQQLYVEQVDITENHRLNLNHLASGTYFLTLKNSQVHQTMKFTIQR